MLKQLLLCAGLLAGFTGQTVVTALPTTTLAIVGSGLTVQQIAPGTVKLTWPPSANGGEGYSLRILDAQGFIIVGDVPPGNSAIVSGLEPGATYRVLVSTAVDGLIIEDGIVG